VTVDSTYVILFVISLVYVILGPIIFLFCSCYHVYAMNKDYHDWDIITSA